MYARHYLFSRNFLHFLTAGCLILFISSCTVVKNYPQGKPFVYKTNINVIGNFTNAEKETLASRLKGQLDDSMRSRSVSQVVRSVMKNPPVYESSNADKSVIFMRALLKSLGYFTDSISYQSHIDTVNKKEYRTTITFEVKPGKVVRIDSFTYNFKNTELQTLALANQKNALVKKGDPFAKSAISVELDRLVDMYRNNGFMRFGREEMIGLWDTLDVSLLRPTFDPLEQAAILQKLRERRENPKASLEIRLKPGYDSSKLKKYYIGNVTVYPDLVYDTAGFTITEKIVDGVNIISYRNMFRPRTLTRNIYFRHRDLYNLKKYQKTINRFNSLGAWRLVNIEQNVRKGEDTADFIVRLTPAPKYSFTTNIEGSQNFNAVTGNLFGFGINLSLLNRNFAKSASQGTTSIRFGVELGNQFVQTQQASFSHNIYFPKPIPHFRWIPDKLTNNIRTLFSFNAANTERRLLYNLTTVNGAWGYEYQSTNADKNQLFQFVWKIPNIEYAYLKPRDSLVTLIANNPVLKNIFTDGFIASTIVNITLKKNIEKRPSVISFNLELPFIAGLIPSKFLDTQLYRFIKTNIDATKQFKFRNSSFVIHAFAGIGYALNSTVNPDKKNALPFFRQYFAGGPNSMRAWRLRRLGPGSAVKDFGQFPDRFGDVQLEFNAEYRFRLFTVAGTKVESALFVDAGNVWFLKKDAGSPEERFNFSRLGEDIAVGAGTGLRLDFSFFLIRVDYAWKIKDPSPDLSNADSQNKWFYGLKQPLKGQLQIGINYPFSL
jgi:outer membrane protein insertion porin family